MKTKPILFSTPMVQAIMDGSKTQTRRIIKPRTAEISAILINMYSGIDIEKYKEELIRTSALVQKGDVLWVRETFTKDCFPNNPITDDEDIVYYYKASMENFAFPKGFKWTPSIFMPKKACRNFLKCTNVRVELLQDISDSDAKAEGIDITDDYWGKEGARNYVWGEEKSFKHEYFFGDGLYGIEKVVKHNGIVGSFFTLWWSINGLESLQLNPYVFVYDFEKTDRPKNFL